MIFLYRFLTFVFFPFFIIITYFRKFKGKEDKLRFKEKISVKETQLPENKKVIWMHAASIGETNSILPLIKEIIKQDDKIFVLLTTTTFSSSQLIKKKKLNRNNFQHRFFTLDVKFLVNRFLNHWRPELVIFVDSEVWPNYLLEIAKRKIPLILINGRITMKTFKRWKAIPSFSRKIFSLYDLCLSSSKESEENLKSLGAKNVKYFGNLKFCPTNPNTDNIDNLKVSLNNNLIWCAASTHPGEEEIILNTHIKLKEKNKKVITIIIPRHISRSDEIFTLCEKFNLNGKIINSFPEINNKNEVYIVNSIGEMTKYFYNCKSIFVGKSFSKKLIEVGGQNPLEPAKCGCKIYHGPFVSNFKEIYDFLRNKNISHLVTDAVNLSEYLLKDFSDKTIDLKKNILELDEYGNKILSLTTKEVLSFRK